MPAQPTPKTAEEAVRLQQLLEKRHAELTARYEKASAAELTALDASLARSASAEEARERDRAASEALRRTRQISNELLAIERQMGALSLALRIELRRTEAMNRAAERARREAIATAMCEDAQLVAVELGEIEVQQARARTETQPVTAPAEARAAASGASAARVKAAAG